MIYRSNLICPDLTPHFKHLHSRVMPHSMGHDVPSDWADKADDDPVFGIYKRCGMLTHDEGAIVYNIARRLGGLWLDIGCHTGWSTAHIGGVTQVIAVDPMLRLQAFADRFEQNMEPLWDRIEISPLISERFFSPDRGFGMPRFYGVLVDGDHEPGKPLEDALNAARHLSETGAIIFHDGIGAPVREAVTALIDRGFHARVYWTPHIVFCCWRGDFKPVDHIGDPAIDWTYHKAAMSKDFDFSRCE